MEMIAFLRSPFIPPAEPPVRSLWYLVVANPESTMTDWLIGISDDHEELGRE